MSIIGKNFIMGKFWSIIDSGLIYIYPIATDRKYIPSKCFITFIPHCSIGDDVKALDLSEGQSK